MKLGAYTACVQDRTLGEVLELLRDMGLDSIEVNSGGFIPAPHIPVDSLMASDRARKEYLAQIADAGLELT
ncbi:MAG: sugar phosphate isomerase/epimerase, partial [Candidatus Dormibacteraeota bacterium]|nr:sugar phosphate isomerase/epimerase [Candidatus Dormibacteraeota bacterium]